MAGAGSWLRPPRWYQALTASWLPERFRQAFALECGASHHALQQRAVRRLRALYKRLPDAIRYTGPWQEAQARLAGKSPGIITRASNRFWIGQYRMPFPDENDPFR
jgi:hypothetical protein